MKKISAMKGLLILLFCIPLLLRSQTKPLMIEGAAPGFYVLHTVAPKENYYSIGRMYNISPKEIAPFNNLVLESGLSLGQAVKIPLSNANFLQSGNAGTDEALVPVYHAVEGKEGLYRISVTYNKVPVETLKQWNNLKADAVSNGTNLVIGYLKVKKDMSSLVNKSIKPAENTVKAVAPQAKTIMKESVTPDQSTATLPQPQNTIKEKPAVPAPDKLKREPVIETVAKETMPVTKTVMSVSQKNFSGGAFKPDYEKQTHDKDVTGETGAAAVFKSTSGWEDGKYYCLHNSSSPGTIMKITNTSTGKSIYAKVLDTIPDIKQNTGLLVRVSNAAAEALGAGDGKFDCTLSYSK